MTQEPQLSRLARFVLARSEQERTGREEEPDSHISGPGPDETPGGSADQHPDDRHAGLEGGENQRDPHAVARLETRHAQGRRERERV
jgi:hypothetical protein